MYLCSNFTGKDESHLFDENENKGLGHGKTQSLQEYGLLFSYYIFKKNLHIRDGELEVISNQNLMDFYKKESGCATK